MKRPAWCWTRTIRLAKLAKRLGGGSNGMHRRVEQLRAERSGHTPGRSAALTPEHQRIQELEARLQKVEWDKEILRKATALLISDSWDQPS